MELDECRSLLLALLIICAMVLVCFGAPAWLSRWWSGESFSAYQNQRAEAIVTRAGNVLSKDSVTYSTYCDKMDGTCDPVEYHDARDLARAKNLTKESLAARLPVTGH